jgi:glycosyltransferase involved in cell wall biosynthesis
MMDSPNSLPALSIITPVRNGAAFLRETIAMVQAQDFEDWEWIVVDDASTDETVALMAEAAASDPRIHLSRQDRSVGLAAQVRNVALKVARAPLLAFLDADDLWNLDKLSRQVAYLEAHPKADGICCWWDAFGAPEDTAKWNSIMRTEAVCHASDFVRGVPFQTSTLVMRRACYDDMGGMNEDPRLAGSEDTEYFARLVRDYAIHRIPEVLSHYRVYPNSYTGHVLDQHNARNWKLFEVMCEKGLFSSHDADRRRGFLYYEQAMNNLYFFEAPFRWPLVQAIRSGHAPPRTWVALALCWLPRPLLKSALWTGQSMLRVVRQRESKKSSPPE